MKQDMRGAILSLGTAVPAYRINQAALCESMVEALGSQPALTRWLRHLYKASGIETRYSCLPDAEASPQETRFAPGRALSDTPTTADRMAIYQSEAAPIGISAAYQALEQYSIIHGETMAAVTSAVTHLIAVSCTGFFAPGLDLAIARGLNLRPTVERTLIGFMGCAAAFNALRLADRIVQSQPSARVLIVCVELCSIHLQADHDRVNLTVGSLFADGAAACLVGAPGPDEGDLFAITNFYTHLSPDTEADMVWKIGNYGFVMQLSPQIPRLIGQVAPQALQTLLDGGDYPQFWAVHPGGRSIVDQIETVFELSPQQIAPTRTVLRRYGNMSSPTILFVLKEQQEQLRQQQLGAPQHGVAMAFGPGLVTEMAHLTYRPADNPVIADADNQQRGSLVETVA